MNLLNTKIKTIPSIQHNKPDLVIWYNVDKMCFIVGVAVELDVNTNRNYNQKNDNYVLLLTEYKNLYPRYRPENPTYHPRSNWTYNLSKKHKLALH